jgi:AraC family transcriptional regulator
VRVAEENIRLTTAAADRYGARFRRVLDYVDAHLDEKLDVEELSGIAAFSKCHFHRQFSELLGVGVYRYISLKRLKRASYQLAFRGDLPITDIALTSGYEGPEAFARAFKRIVGQSPSEFRKAPQWSVWHTCFQPLDGVRRKIMSARYRIDEVRIVTFEDTRVAALEYRGDTRSIGNAIRAFIEWRRQNELSPRVSATFNIVHHHPGGGEEGDCQYELCASTDRGVPVNSLGVVEKVIPGGRCALLRHVGSDDHLAEPVSFLYSQWLPQSGEELRDFPLYFQRVRFFPDVPEHEAVTDIFLPLR